MALRFFFVVAACVAATPTPILTAKHRDDHASSGVDPPAAKHSNKPRKNKHNPNHWRFLVVGEVLMVKKNPDISTSTGIIMLFKFGVNSTYTEKIIFPKGFMGVQRLPIHKTS